MHNTLFRIDQLVYGQIQKIAADGLDEIIDRNKGGMKGAYLRGKKKVSDAASSQFDKLKKTKVGNWTSTKAMPKIVSTSKNPYVRAAALLAAAGGTGYGAAKFAKSASDLSYYFED